MKYVKRDYLVVAPTSLVKNYIDHFTVMKGVLNIRVVFNGIRCGLNGATWSSNLWLTTSSTITWLLSSGYKVVDMDLREMFLNFPLHERLQAHAGVDLSLFKKQLFNIFP